MGKEPDKLIISWNDVSEPAVQAQQHYRVGTQQTGPFKAVQPLAQESSGFKHYEWLNIWNVTKVAASSVPRGTFLLYCSAIYNVTPAGLQGSGSMTAGLLVSVMSFMSASYFDTC